MANKGFYKRKNTLRKKIVEHHIRYQYDGISHKQEERILPIYHNEHYITKLLQTRGQWVSKGFLFVLVDFVLDRLMTGNYKELQNDKTNKKS